METMQRQNLLARLAEPEVFPVRSALWILIAILGVLYLSYANNEGCLLIGLDGASYTNYMEYQALDRTPYTQTGVDAVQGSFDAYYPLLREFLLPSALLLPFTDQLPGKALTYFIYALFVLAAIFVLAHTTGIERPAALLAGLLFGVFGLPGLIHSYSQAYSNFHTNPYWAQNIGCAILMIAAFWALGGGWSRRTLALVPLPLLLFLLAALGTGAQVIFMAPAVVLYGAVSVLDARRWQDNAPRIVAVLFLATVPILIGMGTYFYTLVKYSAYNFFTPEFERVVVGGTGSQPSVSMGSVSTFWHSWFGCASISLGIVGAAWAAYTGTGRLRIYAITHIVVTLLFLPIAYWVAFYAMSYRGSVPSYFEMCIWPNALIFSGVAILAIVRGLRTAAARIWPGVAAVAGTRSGVLALSVPLVLIACYNTWEAVRYPERRCQAQFIPIRPTAITDVLQKNVSLNPGAAFRGIAVTIDGVQGRPSISWMDLHGYDAQLWRLTGNDHRVVGLWHFGVPTAFQYYNFITPAYYLLLTEFLSRPTDRQFRASLVLTVANETMLRLWGMRYVITDRDLGLGRQVAEVRHDGALLLRLLELADVNLGDYSPVSVKRVDTFRSGLAALREPGFDGRRTVVTEAALEGQYGPARDVRLTYETYGFRLRAAGASRSLLVLPMQFSRCWSAEGTGNASLFRANLMQLGVAFSGSLDVKLVFRYGPAFAANCRVDDLRDVTALQVGAAREIARTE